MAKNTNAASRLHTLLAAASKHADTAVTLDVWTTVFEIAEKEQSRRALAVAGKLKLMHDELEELRPRMQQSGISEHMYVPYFNRIEHALSPISLGAHWSGVKPHLGQDALVALAFCSEILPHEEDEVELSELTKLLAEIEELEEALRKATIPTTLKVVIQRQLDLIRTAISGYKIVGARPLREAARAAMVEMLVHKEELKQHSHTPEVTKFGELVKRANKIGDAVIKAKGVIEAGNKIANILLEYLK